MTFAGSKEMFQVFSWDAYSEASDINVGWSEVASLLSCFDKPFNAAIKLLGQVFSDLDFTAVMLRSSNPGLLGKILCEIPSHTS